MLCATEVCPLEMQVQKVGSVCGTGSDQTQASRAGGERPAVGVTHRPALGSCARHCTNDKPQFP